MGSAGSDRTREEQRVKRTLDELESLAHIGSWGFDLETQQLSWTDEMFRLLGVDPTVEPDVELITNAIHPEDFPLVRTAAQRMLEGEKMDLAIRIRRRDGELRTMQARGEYVEDEANNTRRLFGTMQDVTDQLDQESALSRSERRFRTIVAAAPDALVGVDRTGAIVIVNEQTERIFGYTREELLAMRVEDLLPTSRKSAHERHRENYMRNGETRPMGTDLDLRAMRKDGTEFPVDVSLATIETDDGPVVTAFVRDVTQRKHTEEIAARDREIRIRRQQALEINDSVVQGIAVAMLALEGGDALSAVRALGATLDAARGMMGDLLLEQGDGNGRDAGGFVRAQPARVLPEGRLDARPPRTLSEEPPPEAPLRLLIADDTDDLRMLLRYALSPERGFEVVGEARNGAEAILSAKEMQPDVVLLDIAMPVMDGVQALPKIRAVAPNAKIVILSGYGEEQVGPEVRALQPDGYAVKGMPASELISLLHGLFGERATANRVIDVASLEEQLAAGADLELQLATYSHELRTPLTVALGVGLTLKERLDSLPSAVVSELLDSLTRNLRQMGSLLDTLSDVRRVGQHDLQLMLEPCDLAALVRETVTDLGDITKGHAVTVDAPPSAAVRADAVRVRQALSNLISNAARFSPPDAAIEVTVRDVGDEVAIEVADSGPGIPPEAVDKVFRRFERADRKGKGLGLGLYISAGIAEAHGGSLRLTRNGPTGCTFSLALPALVEARRS